MQHRVIHGYQRAFVRKGRGPALLLIHGIGDSSDTWEPLVDELAREYTVIAPDLLGHGRSDKPRADYSVAAYANAMRDLLVVLDVDRATVVGHSLGGGVAMQFAYQYPGALRAAGARLAPAASRARCTRSCALASSPIADVVLPLLRLRAVRAVGRCIVRALELGSAPTSAATPTTCSACSTRCPTRCRGAPSCARCARSSTGAARPSPCSIAAT